MIQAVALRSAIAPTRHQIEIGASEGLLARVVGGNGSYLPRVREVWIFGSYARGALDVGDVDLAVEFDQTKEEPGIWFAT